MSEQSKAEGEIQSQVVTILRGFCPVWCREIESESRLVEDLYVDSMGLVEIVLALNEKFEVDLPDADVELCSTVGDVCRLVERCKYMV